MLPSRPGRPRAVKSSRHYNNIIAAVWVGLESRGRVQITQTAKVLKHTLYIVLYCAVYELTDQNYVLLSRPVKIVGTFISYRLFIFYNNCISIFTFKK